MTATPSRRQLLAGLAAAPVAACTTRRDPAPVDPDDALRAAAVTRERELLAAYDAVTAAVPTAAARLSAVRAEHEQHLAALVRTPVSSAPPTPPAVARTLAQLAALERTSAAGHAADALRASRGLAAVLASLAASEASHPVALA